MGKHWHFAVRAEVGGKRQIGDMHPAFSASRDYIVPLYFLPFTLSQAFVAEHRLCALASPRNYPSEVLMVLSRLCSELMAP